MKGFRLAGAKQEDAETFTELPASVLRTGWISEVSRHEFASRIDQSPGSEAGLPHKIEVKPT